MVQSTRRCFVLYLTFNCTLVKTAKPMSEPSLSAALLWEVRVPEAILQLTVEFVKFPQTNRGLVARNWTEEVIADSASSKELEN